MANGARQFASAALMNEEGAAFQNMMKAANFRAT
jgi:hypothetical protein